MDREELINMTNAEYLQCTQTREAFHDHVIRIVERKFRRGYATICFYMAGATDEDVAKWDKHFGSCRRLDTGYIAFSKRGDTV